MIGQSIKKQTKEITFFWKNVVIESSLSNTRKLIIEKQEGNKFQKI
jgi:hypothetical protein